jgi:hypothetical protein
MRKILTGWRWWLPLVLWSADAHAWGLYTHVYFAQLLLWATPLTDPRFRKAVQAFPRLVLAGACLPDLSLVGRYHGANNLDESHFWKHAQRQLDTAETDAERAIALGFVCHLLVDVIAHNHFVPAHEKMWIEIPLLTHVSAEWAMDRHIRQHLFVVPAALLNQHRHELSTYVAKNFDCDRHDVWRSLRTLANAEAVLRQSRLPEACYHSARFFEARLSQRFNHYLRETSVRMVQINRVLSGEVPQWLAEPSCEHETRARIGLCAPHQIRGRMPLPQDLFVS